MVFLVIMQESSLLTLKSWITSIDIQRFEVLLCIGNKTDLVPGHGAHVEYRRRMQRLGESSSDPHAEYSDFGINESEGFGLLSREEKLREIRNSASQWCIEKNIEYVDACASNADFDKCKQTPGPDLFRFFPQVRTYFYYHDVFLFSLINLLP
jgi:alpha- and gamma-adaptin-binding protein p34